MIALTGADVVLPDRVLTSATIVIEDGRIAEIRSEGGINGVDVTGHLVVPGFIDVHVHGLEGTDALDGADAVRRIAERLPRYGVTAFCPTSVACDPSKLRDFLLSVEVERGRSNKSTGARVLPAHLESNFINPDYCGAQPADCLRTPASLRNTSRSGGSFDGTDVLAEIDRGGDNVGIVTVAPELDGALDLIRHLASRKRIVSLGHSGATLEQSRAAIESGARQATHLFNRMPPLGHREPGLAGAVLASDAIAAEIICDGVHVHHDIVHMAIAAKGVARMMAITDAVAAAGLPDGAVASLGGRRIRVERSAAYLDDGTLAGSIATMDRVFRFLVRDVGVSLSDAARMCATTPASELNLVETGSIAQGAMADLVVLDRNLTVQQTYVEGRQIFSCKIS